MPTQQSNEKSIIQKLDLDGYIHQFKQFLARENPVAMMGDINQHYRYISALSKVQFPTPNPVPNLDRELNLIKKQGVLSL
ncbi:MAG TPA: endonuclease MutS2, partial [Epsilonproteobacteria bacterium]|nr:endonuclease MutS2 [Campylobacterota bacterium]